MRPNLQRGEWLDLWHVIALKCHPVWYNHRPFYSLNMWRYSWWARFINFKYGIDQARYTWQHCVIYMFVCARVCVSHDWIAHDHIIMILLTFSSFGVCTSTHTIFLPLCLLESAVLMEDLGKRNRAKWTRWLLIFLGLFEMNLPLMSKRRLICIRWIHINALVYR